VVDVVDVVDDFDFKRAVSASVKSMNRGGGGEHQSNVVDHEIRGSESSISRSISLDNEIETLRHDYQSENIIRQLSTSKYSSPFPLLGRSIQHHEHRTLFINTDSDEDAMKCDSHLQNDQRHSSQTYENMLM
jgi:hypothetical protein